MKPRIVSSPKSERRIGLSCGVMCSVTASLPASNRIVVITIETTRSSTHVSSRTSVDFEIGSGSGDGDGEVPLVPLLGRAVAVAASTSRSIAMTGAGGEAIPRTTLLSRWALSLTQSEPKPIS